MVSVNAWLLNKKAQNVMFWAFVYYKKILKSN